MVENYLGAKYALPLSGDVTTDGNCNALSGSFRTDVLGIGRASNDSLATASGLGGLSLGGALSTADTWLYAGNDGTANALLTSGSLPAGSAGYWARLWNVAKIGTVPGSDNLSLTFDWAAAGLTSQFDALTDKTTAGFALWSGAGTDVSSFSSLMGEATAVNTLDRTVTFSLTAADLESGENLTLVVVPEPRGGSRATGGLGVPGAPVRGTGAAPPAGQRRQPRRPDPGPVGGGLRPGRHAAARDELPVAPARLREERQAAWAARWPPPWPPTSSSTRCTRP